MIDNSLIDCDRADKDINSHVFLCFDFSWYLFMLLIWKFERKGILTAASSGNISLVFNISVKSATQVLPKPK